MGARDELVTIIESWEPHEYQSSWDERDVITYAISSGADLRNVDLLWEHAPLRVLPTFGSRLGGEGALEFLFAIKHLGLGGAASRIEVEAARPLPPRGTVSCTSSVSVAHEGQDHLVVAVVTAASLGGSPLTTTTTHLHFRVPHDGPRPARPEPEPEPSWSHTAEHTVGAYQAAAFRLLLGVTDGRDLSDGMHIDPAAARAMGLQEPSLQGEATLAVLCRLAALTLTGGDVDQIASVSGRLARPVGLHDELVVSFTDPVDGTAQVAAHGRDGRVLVDEGFVRLRS